MVTKTVTKKPKTAPAPVRFDAVFVCNENRRTKSNTVKTLVKISNAPQGLSRGGLGAEDIAIRQRLLKFSHARFGDFGVSHAKQFKLLQLSHFLKASVGGFSAGQ